MKIKLQNFINKDQMKAQYVSSRDIPSALRCNICTEVFHQAKRLNCGHTFCKDCIDQTFKSDIEKRCPFDRIPSKPFAGKIYQDDLLVQRILSDFNVYCNYLDKGCIW